MKTKNTLTITYERIFKISKVGYNINLKGSFSIVGQKAAEQYFENEVFEITFTSYEKENIISHTLLITANEELDQTEIDSLEKHLGIRIEGSGMQFSILHFKHPFTIQFDKKNSAFIDTEFVSNGFIRFSKS